MKRSSAILSLFVVVSLLSGTISSAQRHGGGGNYRSTARTNVNVNRNVNVNVNNNYYHGGGYYGGGCCYHPVAVAAAVTATAIVTAAVVGSIVNQPPSGCSTQIINGLAYQNCNGTWYQPQLSGSSTTYIVVNAP